jgi:hypothetical protein
MLELVAIFLLTLLISAVAVRAYRGISGWQGFSTTVVARRGKSVRMRLKPQQGYISILTPSRSRPSRSRVKSRRVKAARLKSAPVRTVRLRRSTGMIKAPWGW